MMEKRLTKLEKLEGRQSGSREGNVGGLGLVSNCPLIFKSDK
jgi:hypothetical protein